MGQMGGFMPDVTGSAIDRLRADLMAAGLHASHTDPVIIPKRGGIALSKPTAVAAVTEAESSNKETQWVNKVLCRMLDKWFTRSWEVRMRD
jgi:hypothetical protein